MASGYFSDELYSLKTTADDGYIYVLVKHQSTPDNHMAFRMIRYAVASMQRHLNAGIKRYRWSYRCYSILVNAVLVRTLHAGWMNLTFRPWQIDTIAVISPILFRMMKSPIIAV